MEYKREFYETIRSRIHEERSFIQVVTGPRQVGKTTLVGQLLSSISIPCNFVSADEPLIHDTGWLRAQWESARMLCAGSKESKAIIAIDEVQKISGWSETVKSLWDEDSASGRNLHCILLGSAPLLLKGGLTESLTGRFEYLRLPHWSYREMKDAFGYSFEDYIYFGGYPGAARLISDPARWRRYIIDSLVETTISRDILMMTRVDKPILLRRLFELGCRYSGQILSFNKILGQLQDAGNTTTLAHYLDLLAGVGMVTGLQKYSGEIIRQRSSSPKFQVLNSALLTVHSGLSPEDMKKDPNLRGRVMESAIGAYLANSALTEFCDLFYWREGNREVDFVVKMGSKILAIEVKSTFERPDMSGLKLFSERFKPYRTLLIGGDGIAPEEFLLKPINYWFG